jgi:hypothetical protein
MTLYLVAIHHPDNYDPGVSEDAGMDPAIDALNDDMVAAGVRIFVGGLQPPGRAVSLTMGMDGEVKTTQGPHLKTDEQVGGFWVLDLPDLDTALTWGRKAVLACRAPVEVRAFN